MGIYKVIELVGTSEKSWEQAAKDAVQTASKTINDVRIAEVTRMDLHVENGKIMYRTRLSVSFKLNEK